MSSGFPLTAEALDRLEAILFENDPEEENADMFGVHGMVTAHVTGPLPFEAKEILAKAIPGHAQLGAEDTDTFLEFLEKLAGAIRAQLESDEGFDCPEEVYSDTDARINWCSGFVECFLDQEESWFENHDHQEDLAALLLPLLAHSDIIEDDEIDELRDNDKVMAQMAGEIPENIQDLFLSYHVN